MRFFLASLCVVSVFLCVPGKLRADDLPDVGTVVDQFIAVTLGNRANAAIVKWQRPPIIRVQTFAAEYKSGETVPQRDRIATARGHYEAAVAVAEEVSALTAFPVRVLPHGVAEGGDIVITLLPLRLMAQVSLPGVSETLMRRLRGPGRCFFVIWPGADGGIAKARIFINTQLDESHVKHCFYEEIIQSMGAPHDTSKVPESIFNDTYLQPQLTPLDRHLIQVLYDPRMKIGTKRDDARTLAEMISVRLRRQ